MAELWIEAAGESGWQACEIPAAAAVLTGDMEKPLGSASDEPLSDRLPIIAGRRLGSEEKWVLLSGGARVQVNGSPVMTQIRLLRDRDEIRYRRRMFFSTQRGEAKVEPYEDGRPPLPCARCRKPIEPGNLVVACPACGLFHHETPERRCWSSRPSCASSSCDYSTEPGSGQRWTPEALEET